MYNCRGSTVLWSSVGVFLGFITRVSTGWEDRNPVGMASGGIPVGFLGNCSDVRGWV